MTPGVPSALINHLWQSTLVVSVVWLAALGLRTNAARVRCWLWTAASVKFLVPLSILVSLGERFQWRAAPAAVQPAVSFVMEDVLRPANVVAAAPASIPPSSPVLPWLLLAVWCAGAAVVLISWWRQWLPIRAALRRATPMRLDAQYGAGDLAVMSSPAMPEPGVVGIRRPRLLLPEGILERLTPAQLRALIAHERCHIRCHDNLAAAIHMAVEALFWFHPAVWWIEARLVDERERACDEAVLRSGGRPSDYAEGILEVCRHSAGLRLACVAGVSGSNLRARVETIMRNEIGRPMTRGRRWALAVAVVAAIGGPVAGGALTARSQVVVFPYALTFDTASLKPGKPTPGFDLALEASLLKMSISVPSSQDGQFNASGPLHSLIQMAYNVMGFQVEGGPSWVRTDRYAIEATTAGNAPPDQMRAMLQSLLADRFKLTLRRETRTVPIYELVVADGGLKIAAMKEGECIARNEIRWDLIDLEAPLFVCDGFRWRTLSQSPETRPRPQWPRVARFEAGGTSMSALSDFISVYVDRVVVDRTGFAAPFNLLLDFASPRNAEASGPTIFTALQEQLGLRLRSTSGAVDVLVIDRVERSAEN
jgi:bla regulator protein BlaR1